VDTISPPETCPRIRLCHAIVELVAEHGYRQAVLPTLLAYAGTSECEFYEHFQSTEQCLLAAFDDAIVRGEMRVCEACRDADSWRQQIAVGLSALLGYLDEQPQVARFLVVETLASTSGLLQRRAQVFDRLVLCVDAGRRVADPRLAITPQVAEGLLLTALSVVHESVLSRSPLPLGELSGVLTSLLVLPYVGEDRDSSGQGFRSPPPPSPRPVPPRTA
jgi:AcrR family transcriptional regulator